MENIEWKDPETGRMYRVLQDGDRQIVLGPPDEVVDSLGLPEPFATRLHNALCARGVINYQDVLARGKQLTGALQETLNLDAQRLTEAFYHYQKEEVVP